MNSDAIKNIISHENLSIPKNIIEDKNLNFDEKCFLSVLLIFFKYQGTCKEKNEYFASFMNRSQRTITRLVKKLYQKGYINCVYYDGENARVITLGDSYNNGN